MLKPNSNSDKLFFKLFYEVSNGAFFPFLAVYFSNVLIFSKSSIFLLLSIIPFFSRLIRPFVYLSLRNRISLTAMNLFSILLMIFGLFMAALSRAFLFIAISLAILSVGQGLYRMTLRRELANNADVKDPSAIHYMTMFFLSAVLAPVISYPLGFYALNSWGEGGFIYLSALLMIPVCIPVLMDLKKGNQVTKGSINVGWSAILDKKYNSICLLTFLMVCLASSLAFSAPLILYKGSTTLPMPELIAMSASGIVGLFSTKIFKWSYFSSLIVAIYCFIIAPLLLLYGYLNTILSINVIAIVLFSFATGIVFPRVLSLPNNNKWEGNIEERFFVHSIFMGLGTILNIAISTLFFCGAETTKTLAYGLIILSIIALYALRVIKKHRFYLHD